LGVSPMRRREFITLVGGAVAAWPVAAHAQQAAMPVVGFLGSSSAADRTRLVTAFRQGIRESGYGEGENVASEYRWAQDQYDPIDALLVAPSPLFNNRRVQLATLAAYHRVPAIYPLRDFAEAGGLMSYGTSITEANRLAGVYVGRVLKGAKPADLP